MMRRWLAPSSLALAMAGWLAFAPAAGAADRKAQDILKEINAVEAPQFDPAKRDDRAAVMKFLQERQDALKKKGALIGELYKVDPENAELVKLLPERWAAMGAGGPGNLDELKAEVAKVKANTKNATLKTEAAFQEVRIAFTVDRENPAALNKAADEFIKVAPKDDRCAMILYAMTELSQDEARKTELYKRIAKEYPNSQVAQMVAGVLKRKEAVGKPFELEFTDAIKGTNISMKGLRGKVVVVDFWATWCGPCVAEMPNMKKLYAEYKDKGVEFIGVSLDRPKEEGGLDQLKKFVAEKEIGWPQYYDGGKGEFAGKWGVNAIPTVFVVDAQGNLFSLEARGQLETMIPELLKKAKAGAGTGGN